MSSDRNLTTGMADALVQPHVEWFPLVEMNFDTGDVRIAGVDFPVEYPPGSGIFFTRSKFLASMETITETADSVEGLRFTLAGVPNSVIVEAQQEKYQGRKCKVMLAVPRDGVIEVDPAVWHGKLDVRNIEVNLLEGTSTIQVTAEHAMIDWRRAREQLYNSSSQKLIDPTDTFFDGIENSLKIEKVIFSRALRMR